MRVGLTYDLRSEYLAAGYSDVDTAEFDQPETIDAIAGALARLGLAVESHYGAPQDMEFAIEGGSIYLVQARPITTLGPTPGGDTSATVDRISRSPTARELSRSDT